MLRDDLELMIGKAAALKYTQSGADTSNIADRATTNEDIRR